MRREATVDLGSDGMNGEFSNGCLTRRIARGFGWTLIGAVGGKALLAISSIVLAIVLGPEAFGQYGIVQSTVLMFATYGAFRMGNTAIKYVAQYRESDPAKAARILKLALCVPLVLLSLVTVAVALLSAPLAERTLKAPELQSALLIGAVYMLFLTYGNIVQQALAGFESFKAMSINALLRGALKLLLVVPLGYLWGVIGALGGLVLASAAVLLHAAIFLRREKEKFQFPPNTPWKAAFGEWRVLWEFALPSFFMLALMTGTSWLVRVMLTRQTGFAELGLFEAAGQWATIVYFIPSILARVVMPILSAADGTQNEADYRQVLSLQIRTILLVTGPASVLMIGIGTWLALVYGDRYAGVERLMPLFFVAGFLRALNEACRIVYESKGRQWMGLSVYVVWALSFLMLAKVLLPGNGAMGLALAALVAELVLLVLSGAQVHFRLVPGGLTHGAWLFVRMAALLLLAYLAHVNLPAVYSSIVCALLALVAGFPLLRAIQRSQLRSMAVEKLRSVFSRPEVEVQ